MEVWAEGFQVPRYMMLGPNNEVLITDPVQGGRGGVYILPGKGQERKQLIGGLTRPYGMAITAATCTWASRIRSSATNTIPRRRPPARARRSSRSRAWAGPLDAHLLFDSEGKKLYVGVGSGSNVSPGRTRGAPPSTATIRTAAATRSSPPARATPPPSTGIPAPTPCGRRCRSATSSATTWCPTTSRTSSRAASTAGLTPIPDPTKTRATRAERPDLVAKTIQGDVLLGSHVAVHRFRLLHRQAVPAANIAAARFSLSTARGTVPKRVGQSVAFIPFKDGKPSGAIEGIVTGWMISPGQSAKSGAGRWAVLQMPDGSLLISDDGGRKVWQLSYKG